MRLKNYTDFQEKKIRKIIQFVRPNGISNFDVRISNSKSIFAGCAYTQGHSLHDTANHFIVVRITANENKFPYYVAYKKGTGYINTLLLSREEALVSTIAHELRHLWQAKIKRGHRVWGARGRLSDRDADAYAYAIRKTREWRSKYSSSLKDLGIRWLLGND